MINASPLINWASPQATGLVAFWPLDYDGREAVGKTFATVYGGVSRDVGPNGPCLSFNGSSGYLDTGITANNLFLNASFSVAFWMRYVSNASTQTVLGKHAPISDGGFLVRLQPAGTVRFDAYTAAGSAVLGRSSGAVNNGRWHFVVFAVTTNSAGSSGQDVKIWVDGQQSYGNTLVNTAGVAGSTSALLIGQYSTQWLASKLAGLMMFNRALSDAEVMALYANPMGLYLNNRKFPGFALLLLQLDSASSTTDANTPTLQTASGITLDTALLSPQAANAALQPPSGLALGASLLSPQATSAALQAASGLVLASVDLSPITESVALSQIFAVLLQDAQSSTEANYPALGIANLLSLGIVNLEPIADSLALSEALGLVLSEAQAHPEASPLAIQAAVALVCLGAMANPTTAAATWTAPVDLILQQAGLYPHSDAVPIAQALWLLLESSGTRPVAPPVSLAGQIALALAQATAHPGADDVVIRQDLLLLLEQAISTTETDPVGILEVLIGLGQLINPRLVRATPSMALSRATPTYTLRKV